MNKLEKYILPFKAEKEALKTCFEGNFECRKVISWSGGLLTCLVKPEFIEPGYER